MVKNESEPAGRYNGELGGKPTSDKFVIDINHIYSSQPIWILFNTFFHNDMYPPLKNKNSLDFENKKDLQKTFPINFIPSLAFLPFMKTFLGDFIASLRVLFFLYRDLLFCSYREKHANGKFSNDFPIIRRREDERSPQLFPLCKALPIYLSCFNSVV